MTQFEKQVLELISLHHPKEHLRFIAETALIENDRSIFKDEKQWEIYENLVKEKN